MISVTSQLSLAAQWLSFHVVVVHKYTAKLVEEDHANSIMHNVSRKSHQFMF